MSANDARRVAGWIFYDAECRFCVRNRRRWGKVFERRGFVWLPLQTPGSTARLGVTQEQLMAEMWVLPANHSPLNGINAWIELMCRVWWLWPLAILLRIRGVNRVAQAIYRWIARNRYCIGGSCPVNPDARDRIEPFDWLLATLFPLAAGILCWNAPPWALMWALTFGLGFGLKWLTWRDALVHGARPSATEAFAWFATWPGMDARAFFAPPTCRRPAIREWLPALAITSSGAALIWLGVPLLMPWNPMIAAWVGMVGLVLLLHFGVIKIVSLIHRRRGVHAAPIMNAPLRATSLAEFWGSRWNTGFSIPAKRLVLWPMAKRIGLPAASLMVFLISGLLHEVVISLPARGGFGLPTLYFALQGVGILVERSRLGRKLRLGSGIRGWVFVAIVTVTPLCWLLHPPFLRGVIVPFLNVLTNS